MNKNYQKTLYACFVGYVVQAIINNFVPLLFLTFETAYNIPLSKITMLITINFGIQLLVDLLSAGFVDRIGYKASVIIAHVFSVLGLLGLVTFPEIMPEPYTGLLFSVALYAVGGGLIEVLVSPIIESCPTDNKEKAMSLLHSFYCWGHVGVVLISTVFFKLFGIENWKLLTCIWAVVPFVNIFIFAGSPIAPLTQDGEKGLSILELCKSKVFWILMLMMTCAGASEQAV
ncbi:MAG: MFS transporter, partial [Oscillospiraceae bacterium]|nr:MFS transporter [Oscillospiraceae bacterium]